MTHCVKSVDIRSYSGPYFPAFGLSNSEYGHFVRSECDFGKNDDSVVGNETYLRFPNYWSIGIYALLKIMSKPMLIKMIKT